MCCILAFGKSEKIRFRRVRVMSLWEKWEKEKLKEQGIEVSPDRDFEIQPVHPKANLREQAWIVAGATLVCFALVYGALVLEALYNGRRWSETYLVRLFAEREEEREEFAASQ
jgi:hypothetical protein